MYLGPLYKGSLFIIIVVYCFTQQETHYITAVEYFSRVRYSHPSGLLPGQRPLSALPQCLLWCGPVPPHAPVAPRSSKQQQSTTQEKTTKTTTSETTSEATSLTSQTASNFIYWRRQFVRIEGKKWQYQTLNWRQNSKQEKVIHMCIQCSELSHCNVFVKLMFVHILYVCTYI